MARCVTLQDSIDKSTLSPRTNDRRIAREYVLAQYEGAINSSERELQWFTPRARHQAISADNMYNARLYIADWIAVTFKKLGAARVRV